MSDWTVSSLKEYIDTLHGENRRYIDTLHAEDRKYIDALRDTDRHALEAALESLDKRLVGLNELRSMVTDQQATLLTRNEFESSRRYQEETERGASTGTRQGRSLVLAGIGTAVGVAGLLFGILARIAP